MPGGVYCLAMLYTCHRSSGYNTYTTNSWHFFLRLAQVVNDRIDRRGTGVRIVGGAAAGQRRSQGPTLIARRRIRCVVHVFD